MARAAFGITLYPHDARYNQDATLALSFTGSDLADGALGGALAPVENNQRAVNDAVITRKSGSSARYTQPTGQPYAAGGPGGIGVYNTSPTLNVQTDGVLYNRATWAVHLGTVDADRYPQLSINLRRRPQLAASWANTTIGDRITVDGMFSTGGENPDVLVEGYEEQLGRYQWDVVANCSPYRSWEVFQVGHTRLGRVDARGSVLPADVASGATSLTTSKTAGYLWTTTATRPADFPFDVEISGIQVTVTAITNNLNSNPYFETSVSPWSGQNNATVTRDGTQFHEGAWSMLVTPDGVTAVPQAQSEQFAVVAGRSYTFSAWLRTTSNATRVAGIYWFDAAGAFISANTVSTALTAGVWTQYGPVAYSAPAGAVYARIKTNDPGTPAAGNPWWIDEATVTDATTQVFTVTGVTKDLHAGDTVKVWRPGVIAL
jgi:hypothetical protein